MTETPLTGTWRIVSWENRDEEDNIRKPLGDNPQGYIVYTKEGIVIVDVMAAGRPGVPDGELFACNGEAAIAAANSHVSYCGCYEVLPGGIVHHNIEVCSFPNWIGGVQRRFFELQGDILTLRAPDIQSGGKTVKAKVIWKRVG